jgi:ABC-type branched-subunit amino acid transport system substrate-binding protein
MGSNIVRERVAVVFITLAVAFSGVFGVATVVSYNQAKAVANGNGGTSTDTTSTDPGAAGDTAGASTTGPTGTSGGNGSTGGSTTSSSGGSHTSGHGALATSQADSGVTGDKITVGGIFDMTGAVDSSVERDTVKAYFQKVNAAGGINGRRLEMVDCDSRYDSTAATQCSNQMISSKVLAIVGWTAPKGENDQVSRLTQAGIPIIGGLGTPDEFSSPLSYPVSTPFTRYGQGIAARAKELGIKHPGIVVLSDVPWVATVKQALLDALHAQGIYETHVDNATSTQTDYNQDVLQLKSQNDSPNSKGCASNQQGGACPDGLIAALDPFSYARLFQAMDNQNWHTKILGGGLDKGSAQVKYMDQVENADSLVPFLSPYDHQSNATVSDYLNTVKTYYPNQYPALDVYTQHSWTAAMVFVEALKRAGKNVTRDTLVTALNSIQNFDTGWSKPISYGPGNHDPNHCFMWTHHDGKQAKDGGTWSTVGTAWHCY